MAIEGDLCNGSPFSAIVPRLSMSSSVSLRPWNINQQLSLWLCKYCWKMNKIKVNTLLYYQSCTNIECQKPNASCRQVNKCMQLSCAIVCQIRYSTTSAMLASAVLHRNSIEPLMGGNLDFSSLVLALVFLDFDREAKSKCLHASSSPTLVYKTKLEYNHHPQIYDQQFKQKSGYTVFNWQYQNKFSNIQYHIEINKNKR